MNQPDNDPGRGDGGGGERKAGTTPVQGLAHIAIAVREAEPLVRTLVAALGATRGEEALLDGGALRVVFVHLGPVTLELLEPKWGEHTVAKFLDKRGEGLHHVSLEVPDLDAALDRCRAAGVALIDGPRSGAHGSRVAFLDPKSLGRVLVELSQSRNGGEQPS